MLNPFSSGAAAAPVFLSDQSRFENGRVLYDCENGSNAMALRRARGTILRIVRRRPLAIAVGAALAGPAAWLEFRGSGTWWLDGISLLLGATGAALIWTGLTGPQPDWVDPEDGGHGG